MRFLRSLATLALLLGPVAALAQSGTRVTDMTAVTSLDGTEAMFIDKGGPRKVSPSQMLAYFRANGAASTTQAGVLGPLSGNASDCIRGNGSISACPSGGGGGGTTLHLGYTSGRIYRSGPYATASGLISAANTVYAQPILLPQGATITDLGIRVLTGQASSAGNICLYPNVNGLPSGNLIGGVTVTPTASAANATGTLAAPWTASAGVAWAIQIYNSTSTMPTTLNIGSAEPQASWQLGIIGTGNYGANLTGLAGTVGGTTYTGTCPATAPTGLTDSVAGIPLVSFKVQ